MFDPFSKDQITNSWFTIC